MADLMRKYLSLYSSTASTFGTGTGVTITPASVVGLPTDTEITLTFDRVDSTGTATPAKLERIIGTISGANFVVRTAPASGRGADGTTEQAHTSPVVEMIWNAKDWNDAMDAFLVAHLQTGAHASSVVTLTDIQTLTNKTLTKPVINGTNPTGATYTPATGSQTVALDCAANNMHIVTGHGSGTAITFTVANATNNQPFIVSILQGAVVSTIAGWFATVRWAGGSAPTLTATVGKRDVFGFIRTGADTYDGFVVGQNL